MYIVHLQDLTQTLKHANYWTNTSHSTKEQCICVIKCMLMDVTIISHGTHFVIDWDSKQKEIIRFMLI